MHSPVATIQDLYARFGQGDVPGILALMRPDIEWEPDTLDHGIPWVRPGHGLEHVASFFGELAKLEFHAFVPEAFVGGERHVAVYVRHDVTNKATGKRFAGVEIHWWTFDEHGKIAAMKHFVDTVQHRAAASQ
jgi:ketosteroid isomerase-like protein